MLFAQSASLNSASPKERQEAVEQMAIFGNAPAIAPLADALRKEPKSDIRATIVAGLGRIRDKSAAPILAETLASDLDNSVRLQAIEAFERLYIPAEDSGPIKTIFSRVKSAIAGSDRPVVADETTVEPPIAEALADAMKRSSSPEVRAAAARALGSLKARTHVAALIASLENPQNQEHEDVRFESIQSLGLLRDPAAGPALKKVLEDPGKRIVMEAVAAIGLVGFKEARADLESIFRTDSASRILSIRIDRDRDLRRRALESLSLMRDPASQPLFESLLADTDDRNREIAAEGLARLHFSDPKLKALYETERKPAVRVALAYALVASGQDNYFGEIANALATSQSYQAEAYLYEIGRYEGKLGMLHTYLPSGPAPKIRAGMIRVLADIGDPSSKALIQPLTMDRNEEVLRAALAAMRRYSAR
jgi:HEAT repeat protein